MMNHHALTYEIDYRYEQRKRSAIETRAEHPTSSARRGWWQFARRRTTTAYEIAAALPDKPIETALRRGGGRGITIPKHRGPWLRPRRSLTIPHHDEWRE
jgi:hypothetical protein